jgi:hypothetical protein
MNFPLYIYNTTLATLAFEDVGLEIPSHNYFEVSKPDDLEKLYYSGSELFTAIESGDCTFVSNGDNYPPIEEDIISNEEAQTILSPTTLASYIVYDDTETYLLANNVQAAIKNLKDIVDTVSNTKTFDGGTSNSTYLIEDTLSGGGANTDYAYFARVSCGSS